MRDTIEMAREADLIDDSYASDWYVYQLKAFEALVRADEREALQAEVLEQCRINGMSAEREDALRAELTRLKASIALDKMADNARELGLDYETPPKAQTEAEKTAYAFGWCKAMEYARQNGVINSQPAPVKTYSGGKPWPVAPKPWVGLSEEEINKLRHLVDWTAEWSYGRFAYELERLLREKNHG
jgi:hypothetical protein